MSAYDDSTEITNPATSTHVFEVKEHRRPAPASSNPSCEIDFDEASAAWMANKVRSGPCILYKCTAIKKDGNPCAKPILHHEITDATVDLFVCKMHARLAHPPSKTSAKGKSLSSKDKA